MPNPLTKKVGPFPVIVWVGIVGGGIALAIVVRKRTQAAAEGVGTDAPAVPGGPTDMVGLDAPFPASSPFAVGPPVYSPPFGERELIDDTGLGGTKDINVNIKIEPPPSTSPRAIRRPKTPPRRTLQWFINDVRRRKPRSSQKAILGTARKNYARYLQRLKTGSGAR